MLKYIRKKLCQWQREGENMKSDETIEEIIRKIQNLFKEIEVEVKIYSVTQQHEKCFACEIIYIDDEKYYGIEHSVEFCKNEKNDLIDNVSVADITQTGENICEALTNLYNYCKKFIDHNYIVKIM
jgi:hypothetical protein